MDLKALESEYNKLKDTILESMGSENSMLWDVCYRWWSVYRSINDQLAGSKGLEERDQIIGSFAAFQGDFVKELKIEYAGHGVDLDNVAPLDDKFDSFPKHMQDIILVMRMQRSSFIDNVKAVKAEKKGKGSKVTRKLARRKRKWLKS